MVDSVATLTRTVEEQRAQIQELTASRVSRSLGPCVAGCERWEQDSALCLVSKREDEAQSLRERNKNQVEPNGLLRQRCDLWFVQASAIHTMEGERRRLKADIDESK